MPIEIDVEELQRDLAQAEGGSAAPAQTSATPRDTSFLNQFLHPYNVVAEGIASAIAKTFMSPENYRYYQQGQQAEGAKTPGMMEFLGNLPPVAYPMLNIGPAAYRAYTDKTPEEETLRDVLAEIVLGGGTQALGTKLGRSNPIIASLARGVPHLDPFNFLFKAAPTAEQAASKATAQRVEKMRPLVDEAEDIANAKRMANLQNLSPYQATSSPLSSAQTELNKLYSKIGQEQLLGAITPEKRLEISRLLSEGQSADDVFAQIFGAGKRAAAELRASPFPKR